MKSAIFESLNDRSNITNAYLKMLNESTAQKDDSQINESVENGEDGIDDVEDIAGELVGYLYSKYPEAAFIGEKRDDNGDILLKYDFSRTKPQIVKDDIMDKFGKEKVTFGSGNTEYAPEIRFDVIVVHASKTVEESEENDEVDEDEGFFSPQGELVKEIPQECVDACTKPGADAYDDCSRWVDELEFDKGLDIAKAKGFLLSTGGWERKELSKMDPKNVAIRLLWIICGDIKDGSDFIYIGDAEPFDESCDESAKKRIKVVVTRIDWDEEGVANGLPENCSVDVEVEDVNDVDDEVSAKLSEKFNAVPKGFNVAKVVEIDSGDIKTNEIVDQKELDNLMKKYDAINEKR